MINLERYEPQISLPNFGISGQKYLSLARVAVVGAGGLGSPVLSYLSTAGVGHLSIIDFDVVEERNLQRQFIHKESSIGESKAISAGHFVKSRNSEMSVESMDLELNLANSVDILSDHDLIIDASDNFDTRYLISDAAGQLSVPFISGAVHRYEGHVYVCSPAHGFDYRSIFPEPVPDDFRNSCSESGVLGPICGIVGSMMTSEALKVLTRKRTPHFGSVLKFDSLSMELSTLPILHDLPDSLLLPEQESFPDDNSVHILNRDNYVDFFLNCTSDPILFYIGSNTVDFSRVGFPVHTIDTDRNPLDAIASKSPNQTHPLALLCDYGMRSEMFAYGLARLGFSRVASFQLGLQTFREIFDGS